MNFEEIMPETFLSEVGTVAEQKLYKQCQAVKLPVHGVIQEPSANHLLSLGLRSLICEVRD